MSITVSTDQEADRMLALRASSLLPLPREIALCDPRDAREYFQWIAVYEAFGLADHPLVQLLGKRRLDAAMASAVSRAEHVDRVSHYSAWPPRPRRSQTGRAGVSGVSPRPLAVLRVPTVNERIRAADAL